MADHSAFSLAVDETEWQVARRFGRELSEKVFKGLHPAAGAGGVPIPKASSDRMRPP